jgi:hypothetical protein
VASAAGPVVGGFLSVISWRAIFFVNVPVGLAALCLLTAVPRSPRRPAPFDWVGQVAAVLAMGGLTYGLIEGGAAGFAAMRVAGSLTVAVVAAIIFVFSQARGAHPMMPLDLFRSRPLVISISAGFSFVIGFYGLVFLLSLYLQEVRGLSPLATGLTFLPMTALSAFVNPVSARLAALRRPRADLRGAFPDGRGPARSDHHDERSTYRRALHIDASHRAGRRFVHAARDGPGGRQRPARARRHGERRVQHLQAARRHPRDGHLRRASRPPDLPHRPARQPADRRCVAARNRAGHAVAMRHSANQPLRRSVRFRGGGVTKPHVYVLGGRPRQDAVEDLMKELRR